MWSFWKKNVELNYDHYSEVPKSLWPWENFTPEEIASNGDGSIKINVDAMNRLQHLREVMRIPLRITSAYRDPIYNARIGGAPRSAHKEGIAFDILLGNLPNEQENHHHLCAMAAMSGFTGFGFYRTFLHVDTGPKRQWYGKGGKELWNG